MSAIYTIPDDKVKELEERYPDGHLLTGPEGHQIFVDRPGRKEWKRFMQGAEAPGKRMDALEQLVHDCRVYPDAEVLNKMLDSRPALGGIFGQRCMTLAGLVGEAEVKKR